VSNQPPPPLELNPNVSPSLLTSDRISISIEYDAKELLYIYYKWVEFHRKARKILSRFLFQHQIPLRSSSLNQSVRSSAIFGNDTPTANNSTPQPLRVGRKSVGRLPKNRLFTIGNEREKEENFLTSKSSKHSRSYSGIEPIETSSGQKSQKKSRKKMKSMRKRKKKKLIINPSTVGKENEVDNLEKEIKKEIDEVCLERKRN
jgi:hypothetical protein